MNTLDHINQQIASTETDLAAMQDLQNEQRFQLVASPDDKQLQRKLNSTGKEIDALQKRLADLQGALSFAQTQATKEAKQVALDVQRDHSNRILRTSASFPAAAQAAIEKITDGLKALAELRAAKDAMLADGKKAGLTSQYDRTLIMRLTNLDHCFDVIGATLEDFQLPHTFGGRSTYFELPPVSEVEIDLHQKLFSALSVALVRTEQRLGLED